MSAFLLKTQGYRCQSIGSRTTAKSQRLRNKIDFLKKFLANKVKTKLENKQVRKYPNIFDSFLLSTNKFYLLNLKKVILFFRFIFFYVTIFFFEF